MTETQLSIRLKRLVGMPATEFVLHREPMSLLDRLIDVGPEHAVCEWTVCGQVAFMSSGVGVPTYVGIEYMAQCIAVHAGALARVRERTPPLGFLLGTRHFHATAQYFDLGRTYSVTCRELIRDARGMGSFECSISLDNKSVASARLAVLEKEEGRRLDG